ncbi:unnamed protein product, partial [Cuscuta epithymum]
MLASIAIEMVTLIEAAPSHVRDKGNVGRILEA